MQVLSVKTHEDGDAVRSYLSKLKDLNLVAEARSGDEALQLLRDKPTDVVVIDFGRSDTGGVELTRKIKELHPSVRVLVVTASNTAEDIFSTLDAGADGYLLKENLAKALEISIRSVRLGAVWLDPGIARQVLVAAHTPFQKTARVLPTGVMPLPLLAAENALLTGVADSSCVDGVCMVDPSFILKLKRFAPTA